MPLPVPNSPDRIATPEGDNEFAPDQPLGPLEDQALVTPPGSEPEPHPDESGSSKPKGIEKFIDEVARGEFM
jgi:hypothetical protein